jgi:hypothetical protein
VKGWRCEVWERTSYCDNDSGRETAIRVLDLPSIAEHEREDG